MATSKGMYDGALETLSKFAEDGPVTEADADAIRELCAAYDAEDATATLPKDLYDDRQWADGHKKFETLTAWVHRLMAAAKHLELTAATADDINEFTTGLVKADDGPGRWYVQSLEYTLSKFYRYHSDLGVDPRGITKHDPPDSSWDERDLLDADERLALRTVAEHPRDLVVYHLLVYCGMRNTALRTLRVRDIEIEDHEWYFNTAADGLKDIHRPSEPRPLFQAERAAREWVTYHPTGDPDHFLITGKPKYSKIDPTAPVSRETIRRTMQSLKDRTAERADIVTVEKPCHPHMMRHNFVSMCRKHPDITDADIKFYLGHAPDSTVMETTYSHLTSKDHNARGHAALGVSSAASNGAAPDPWDTTCGRCDRALAPGETVCSVCQTPREATPWDTPAGESLAVELARATSRIADADPDLARDVIDAAAALDPESPE